MNNYKIKKHTIWDLGFVPYVSSPCKDSHNARWLVWPTPCIMGFVYCTYKDPLFSHYRRVFKFCSQSWAFLWNFSFYCGQGLRGHNIFISFFNMYASTSWKTHLASCGECCHNSFHSLQWYMLRNRGVIPENSVEGFIHYCDFTKNETRHNANHVFKYIL